MSAPAQNKATVMIVEDEIMIAMHMSMLIKRLGYDIVGIAVDRESALALADKGPDVVLVDCKLRDGVTGPSIGHDLAVRAGAAVIYITANPQYVSDPKLVHPSILGVYPKPVNDNEIEEILQFALMARRGEIPPSPPSSLRPISV